ncbi:tRNA (adenine(22)-N(1))-methyltransferase [Bacillus chungangensis]|uniref:tRNA (Adenine22-N1)-methyltransferase n=1 Tax=Bacillus chungangensis TaxID=587633 RepID=A0ABT9WPP5_9BACI|nr:tRNA (adenine(22)-N(1))-methyltransferase TrmK [Bacillus chungangensis]MDQ0175214.1 tRNA (adenine22-N1)-methyltransferase [Bacillus chungangensis]
MNSEHLSKRLACVASFVPKGSVLADIGSDHAYLPCFLVKAGMIQAAIAGEVAKGPYTSAYNEVRRLQLEKHISVRMGDGLAVLEKDEGVSCITIAGMGGALITSILEKGEQKLANVTRLVLQPNVGAQHVRKWLIDHDWLIIGEAILEEDNCIYEIIGAEKDGKSEAELNEAELLMGPFLLKDKHPVFINKWTEECRHWQQILARLQEAKATPEIEMKKQTLLKKIQLVEEALL